MRISLATFTDLGIVRVLGGTVETHADHMLSRTPALPDYRWGHQLAVFESPTAGSAETWIARSREAFGDDHVAVAGMQVDAMPEDPAEWEAAGVEVNVHAVLGIDRPLPDAAVPAGVEVRPLDPTDDAAWAEALDIRIANRGDAPHHGEVDFLGRKLDAMRQATRAGYGAWFGAFVDGTMRSGCGIFAAGELEGVGRIARYQDVDTHPEFRRRGLAGAVVRAAETYARDTLGARVTVIVAERDGDAHRLYASLGFGPAGTQLQLERS